MKKLFSQALLDKMPIIGIMRNVPGEHIVTIAERYCQAGLTCLEITMNSPNAEKSIATLVDLYGDVLNIGAGTVCSMHDLEKALTANAQFIVTPVINEEVIKACVSENIPIFPGAYTPSEMYKAWQLGARMIKLFPAATLPKGYIREVLAPLSFISIMPTGGVSLANLTDTFADGAKAVGIGSHLFPKEIINRQDWDALSEVYLQFVNKYNVFTGRV